MLAPLRAHVQALIADLAALASCEFDFEPQTPASGESAELHARLVHTLSNLGEALRQAAGLAAAAHELAEGVAAAGHRVAEGQQDLGGRLQAARRHLAMQAPGAAENVARAGRAAALAAEAADRNDDARAVLADLVDAIDTVAGCTRQVDSLVTTLGATSEDTHRLALEGTAQAARTGATSTFEPGADAMHAAATRTGQASAGFQELLRASSDMLARAQALAGTASRKVQAAGGACRDVQALIGEVAHAANTRYRGLIDATVLLDGLESVSRANGERVARLHDDVAALARRSAFVHEALQVFRLNPEPLGSRRHRLACELAAGAATAVEQAFEQAIRSGYVTLEDVFDERYVAVPGTEPPQYHTRFDALADDLLPPIQDRLLHQHSFLKYAGVVDRNGYLPTINAGEVLSWLDESEVRLTDDDDAGNPAKRIFADRVGQACGSHTGPFLLQTYRRGDGALMFDLSVPIRIGGRHWGGFRIGYRA